MNKPLRLATFYLLLASSAGLAAEEVAAPPPTFALRPLTDFQRMLERPLFNASRRPGDSVTDDQVSSADEQQLRDNWRLTGVLIEPGKQLALLTRLKGDNRVQLEPGAVLDNNWVLEQVAGDHVVLLRSGQRIEILLYDPAALPMAAPAKTPADAREAKPKALKLPGAGQPKIPAAPG